MLTAKEVKIVKEVISCDVSPVVMFSSDIIRGVFWSSDRPVWVPEERGRGRSDRLGNKPNCPTTQDRLFPHTHHHNSNDDNIR